MEELYRREDRYSTLEDNIRAATQTVMITSKLIESNKPGRGGGGGGGGEEEKPPESKKG